MRLRNLEGRGEVEGDCGCVPTSLSCMKALLLPTSPLCPCAARWPEGGENTEVCEEDFPMSQRASSFSLSLSLSLSLSRLAVAALLLRDICEEAAQEGEGVFERHAE